MITPIIALGDATAPSTTLTNYYPITGNDGGSGWLTVELQADQVISVPGVLSNMRIVLATAPGAGKNQVFTIRKNGADTTLTVTITGASTTSGKDLTHTVSVIAGDVLSLSSVPSGTPASSAVSMSLLFTGNSTNDSPILYADIGGARSTTLYAVPQGNGSSAATADSRAGLVSTPGNLKNLYFECSVAPGVGNTAICTLRLNGVDTLLVATVSGLATTANDTSDVVAVVAGDVIDYKFSFTGTPAATFLTAGMQFAPTTDGESLLIKGTDATSAPSTTVTDYEYLIGHDGWGNTENVKKHIGLPYTFKNLYVKLGTAPGASKSFQFAMRDAGSTKTLSVTISGASTTGNNKTNVVQPLVDDAINYISIPTSTPTAPGIMSMGMTVYVIPYLIPTYISQPYFPKDEMVDYV